MLISSGSLPKSKTEQVSWGRAPRTLTIKSSVNPNFTYFGGGKINPISIIIRKMKYGLDVRYVEDTMEPELSTASSSNKKGNFIYQVTLIPGILSEISEKSFLSEEDSSRRKSFDFNLSECKSSKDVNNLTPPTSWKHSNRLHTKVSTVKDSKPSHGKRRKSGNFSKFVGYIRDFKSPKKNKLKTSSSASKLDFNVKLIRTYCNDSELINTSKCTFPSWLWNRMILTIRYFLPLLEEFDQTIEEFFSIMKINFVIKHPSNNFREQNLISFKSHQKIPWKETSNIPLVTNIKLSEASQIVRPLSSSNQGNIPLLYDRSTDHDSIKQKRNTELKSVPKVVVESLEAVDMVIDLPKTKTEYVFPPMKDTTIEFIRNPTFKIPMIQMIDQVSESGDHNSSSDHLLSSNEERFLRENHEKYVEAKLQQKCRKFSSDSLDLNDLNNI